MRLRSLGAATAGLAVTATLLTGGTAVAAPAPPTRAQIIQTMKLVDAYWIAHGPDQAPNNWQNSTFNVGNLAFVTTTGVANHYTLPWAQKNKFLVQSDPNRPFFPDWTACGEAYLDLQKFHNDPAGLASLRGRIRDEVASVEAGHDTYWNYVDALNMAMPSFARIGVLDNSEPTLAAMQRLFHYTEKVAGGHGLYNPAKGLWWRDRKYVGTSTYWSRGNGWALMAMAKVLQALPASDPRRGEYAAVLTRMAATLKATQRADGFWNVDLGNPNSFPGPESSGTAFFTYGITWGINHGLLPAATYRPVVERAWQGLVTKAVRGDGLLGYVQGPGSKPSDHQPVTATDTAAYAVGGFLLAGSELAKLET